MTPDEMKEAMRPPVTPQPTGWMVSARSAGYTCGFFGHDPRSARHYYGNPGNSLDAVDAAHEFDRGHADGEVMRGVRLGYLPTMGGKIHGFKEYPAKPRAMMPEDIAEKIPGCTIFRELKEMEMRRMKTEAYYFLQYVLATGKMKLEIPDYAMDFARDMLDKPRAVTMFPQAPKTKKPDAYADLAAGIFEVSTPGARKIGKVAELGIGYAGEVEKRRTGWAKVRAILDLWRGSKGVDTGPSGPADE